MVRKQPTMVATGDGELGFDSGDLDPTGEKGLSVDVRRDPIILSFRWPVIHHVIIGCTPGLNAGCDGFRVLLECYEA